MKIVIDMNLTPLWGEVLTMHGFQAVHWYMIGDPRAKDSEIMNWGLTKQRGRNGSKGKIS